MNGKSDPIWAIALSGFFGAISPSISTLVSQTQEPDFTLPHAGFFLGTFLLGILGMGIVLIAKEKIMWKAFTQGLSAPTIFSSAGNVVIAVALISEPSGLMSVYADSTMLELSIKEKDSVYVNIQTPGKDTFNIITEKQMYKLSPNSIQQIKIPKKEKIVIEDDKTSVIYNVSDTNNDTLDLLVKSHKKHRTYDFIRGLFPLMRDHNYDKVASRTIQIEETEIKPVSMEEIKSIDSGCIENKEP